MKTKLFTLPSNTSAHQDYCNVFSSACLQDVMLNGNNSPTRENKREKIPHRSLKAGDVISFINPNKFSANDLVEMKPYYGVIRRLQDCSYRFWFSSFVFSTWENCGYDEDIKLPLLIMVFNNVEHDDDCWRLEMLATIAEAMVVGDAANGVTRKLSIFPRGNGLVRSGRARILIYGGLNVKIGTSLLPTTTTIVSVSVLMKLRASDLLILNASSKVFYLFCPLSVGSNQYGKDRKFQGSVGKKMVVMEEEN
ncbi:hypothetical protein G4B88_028723 [Cannabis sativa]|uniref:Uncharacterized protein n=1 Tax=Cannabis sativa TaxID=3483 RepID=A0A7J6EYE0_CANSA|nr:hypothetical protein G4B88_028723 [Cannabis sativa]